jgi:uncharacterized protein (TIGR03067 family)
MDKGAQRGVEGAWVPIDASVAGKQLPVDDLRVRYFVLEAGGYRIIDRSNRVVDDGRYLIDPSPAPPAMDIVGQSGLSAGRTMHAIYELEGDELTVCYDLQGGERPAGMRPRKDQLLLRITYTRAAIGCG